MASAVPPGVRARTDGLIILVSSTAGRGAFPGFGVYHASKWGLEGMEVRLHPGGMSGRNPMRMVKTAPFASGAAQWHLVPEQGRDEGTAS